MVMVMDPITIIVVIIITRIGIRTEIEGILIKEDFPITIKTTIMVIIINLVISIQISILIILIMEVIIIILIGIYQKYL